MTTVTITVERVYSRFSNELKSVEARYILDGELKYLPVEGEDTTSKYDAILRNKGKRPVWETLEPMTTKLFKVYTDTLTYEIAR